MDAAQNIYLVMKEAINNALKYSDCSKIYLDMSKKNGLFTFSIKDNGKGFSTEKPASGNGLSTMKERIEEIGGKFSLDSSKKGTTVFGELNI